MKQNAIGKWLVGGPPILYLLVYFAAPSLILVLALLSPVLGVIAWSCIAPVHIPLGRRSLSLGRVHHQTRFKVGFNRADWGHGGWVAVFKLPGYTDWYLVVWDTAPSI